jgi:hypothetical protein
MRGWLIGVLLLSLPACGDDEPPRDGGVDAAPPDLPAAPDLGPPPPPMAEPGRHDVEVVETRRVIPSDGLPAETTPLNSNNNLDVVRFEDRVYLAWRTAPDHFASEDTIIHVISSADEMSWDFEASFAIGTDLREPAFLVHEGELFLYVSVLGTEARSFDPMGVRWTRRSPEGEWSELADVPNATGYIAWATKSIDGVSYMSAYEGGEHIYRFDGMPLFVELRTTTDGIDWTPLTPNDDAEQTWVYSGGGSEMDFAFGDDGGLHAVIRNEAGDDNGWGTMVCDAPADDIANWTCDVDRKKYDSPHVFAFDGEIYLLGRRNVTETGFYDIATDETDPGQRTLQNQVAYTSAEKRCSLWRFVQGERRIAYLLDLPSKGDTCFAASLEAGEPTAGEPHDIVIYDYSSDVDGEDVSWREGQRGPTFIYRHVLRLTPRD